MSSKINIKYVCTYLVTHSMQKNCISTNKFGFCLTIVDNFIIILIRFAFNSHSIIWPVSVSYNTIFHRIYLVCHGTKRKISTRLQVCCISLVAGVCHVTFILQRTVQAYKLVLYDILPIAQRKYTKLIWKRLRKNWTARVLIVNWIFIF